MLMLLFQVGADRYALDTEDILEIFPRIKLKQIPHANDFIAGLISYRGNPIPIVDLSMLICGRASVSAMHTRIIILQHIFPATGMHQLGLIAEKVTETKDLEPASFIESGLTSKDLPFLGGIYNEGNTSIQLVKSEELFIYTLG